MGEKKDTSQQRTDESGQHHSGAAETLTASTDEAYVADTVTFQGRSLAANQSYELHWHTYSGRWGVLEANEILGPQYQHRTELIATVTTDDSGQFEEQWRVFEDFGGTHTVELRQDDSVVDQTELEILPWFELDQTTVQLGDTVTLSGYGIGPDVAYSNYQVTWDNGYVGFVTGVQNRGTAKAKVRAVGPLGTHVLQVWRNFSGIPYLQNNTQSPYGPVGQGRPHRFTIEVTEPDDPPATAWVDSQLDESPISAHYPEIDVDGEATLELTPQSGQAGTSVFIDGRQFPPEETIDLVWFRHEGHHRQGNITPEPALDVLPSVTSDEDGRFQVEIEIPSGQGGTRPIAAVADGKPLALSGVVVQPAIEQFEPTSGPVGTTITIELSGIGWTSYENQPFFLYDNKPLGVVSSTTEDSRNGIVRVEFPATGDPGWHFIDVYPTLATVEADEPDFERWPHLSYLHNHPVRPLPGMHFAFEVTE